MRYKLRYKDILGVEQEIDVTAKVLANQLPLAVVTSKKSTNEVAGVITLEDANKSIERIMWEGAKYSAIMLDVYTSDEQLIDTFVLTGKYERKDKYFLELEYATYIPYTPTQELEIVYGEANYISSLKTSQTWVAFPIAVGTSRKVSFWWGVKVDEDLEPHEITYATIGTSMYALFRNVLVKFKNSQPYTVEKIVRLADLCDPNENTNIDILLPSKNLQTPKTLRGWIVAADSTTIKVVVNTAQSREGGNPSVNCFAVWNFDTNLNLQSKEKFLISQENFSQDVCYYTCLGSAYINGVRYYFFLEKNPTNAKLIWGNTSNRYTASITYFSNNITKLATQAVGIDRGTYADVLIPAPRSLWLKVYSSGTVTTVATTDITLTNEKASFWRCYYDGDYSRLYYIAHRITSTSEQYQYGYFSINFGGNTWTRTGVRTTTAKIYGYGFDDYTKQDIYILRDRVVRSGTTEYFAHFLYDTRYLALTTTTPYLCLYVHTLGHAGMATIASNFYYSCSASADPTEILEVINAGYVHSMMLRPFPTPQSTVVVRPSEYILEREERPSENYRRPIITSLDSHVCAATPAYFVAADKVVQLATYAECADYIARIYPNFYTHKYITFSSQNNYTDYIAQCIAIIDPTNPFLKWYAILLAYSYNTSNTYTYTALVYTFEEEER